MSAKTTTWLRESDRRLRTAVAVFAVFLILDVLLYAVFVAPTSARLAAGELRYGEYRKNHADAILFKRQKPSVAGLMAGIPAQKDMPLIVKELVQTAKRLNLSVASVKYDIPKQASGELALLSFSFPAEGRYADIKRFIYDVETSDQLVGIQNMKMDTEKGKVRLELKLLTYIKGQ